MLCLALKITVSFMEPINSPHILPGNVSTTYFLCPRGFYCEAGTGRNWSACPSGTYSNQLGLTAVSECTDCPGESIIN